MQRITQIVVLAALGLWLAGCSTSKQPVAYSPPRPAAEPVVVQTPLPLTHINAFLPETAADQAREVVESNPYSQDFFEQAFARLVDQCSGNASPGNAEVIWQRFVEPLSRNGKVPADLARGTWNTYFSRSFVSLPAQGPVAGYCHRLEEIKTGLEQEYRLKTAGFQSTAQGSPDAHFLNAMYVYNTMWAACRDANTAAR
jgi:hypothetical protein